MAENPPSEKLSSTTVVRSLVQKTSSNTTGIATNDSLRMLETIIYIIYYYLSL